MEGGENFTNVFQRKQENYISCRHRTVKPQRQKINTKLLSAIKNNLVNRKKQHVLLCNIAFRGLMKLLT